MNHSARPYSPTIDSMPTVVSNGWRLPIELLDSLGVAPSFLRLCISEDAIILDELAMYQHSLMFGLAWSHYPPL